MKKRKKSRKGKTGVKNKRHSKPRISKNVTSDVLNLFIQKPDKNYTSKEIQKLINANKLF